MGVGQGAVEDLGLMAFGAAFKGRTVLITGHTGFKGSWLSLWLHDLGAQVVGYSLAPDTNPSLFRQLGLSRLVDSRLGDIRDVVRLRKVFRETRPEIVFHLAAQPLVLASYEEPAETFAVNVQGTVNVLEAIRGTPSVRGCVVITTDKCYENLEKDRAFREGDRLGGRDPYAASKACAEMVASSYRDSFFSMTAAKRHPCSISSARAGNVIGGGDWAKDRLIPDCIRALKIGKPPIVRNPGSTRPWQHVLEPLRGYLRLAELQLAKPEKYADAWNFGPQDADARTAGQVADLVVRAWGSGRWTAPVSNGRQPHEARFLRLDSSKARAYLGWRPVCNVEEAVAKTVAWYSASTKRGFDAVKFSLNQLREYQAASASALRGL